MKISHRKASLISQLKVAALCNALGWQAVSLPIVVLELYGFEIIGIVERGESMLVNLFLGLVVGIVFAGISTGVSAIGMVITRLIGAQGPYLNLTIGAHALESTFS